MKLAVAFVLSSLVLLSQQQRFTNNFQSRVLTPWAFQDYQFNENDLYSYLLARRLAQSTLPALPQLETFAVNKNSTVSNGLLNS